MSVSAGEMRVLCRRELRRLLASLLYFTRVPVPAGIRPPQSCWRGAAGYLTVVGLVVGASSAGVYLLACTVFPAPLAILFGMVSSIALTGAVHEDGLADAADGLGGAVTRARALEIMKDSRIGAFGVLSLTLVLLGKFQALLAIGSTLAAASLVAGHTLSRLAATAVLATLPYARAAEDSHTGTLVSEIPGKSFALAALVGLLPLALLGRSGLIGLLCVTVTTLGWRRYIRRRLGGYTGDCLGAAQQLTELSFYLGLLAASR